MYTVSRLAVVLGLIATPHLAAAQQVELISDDGLLSVEGTLQDFDGKMISVATSYGLIKIPASEVLCKGDCPAGVSLAANDTAWNVSFESARQRILMRTLLSLDFVADNAGVEVEADANGVDIKTAAPASMSTLTYVDQDDDANLRFELGSRAATSFIPGVSLNPADADGRQAFELAIEPFAIVLGDNTGVEALSFENLAEIYSGDYSNWSELGGNDLDIQLYATANAQIQLESLEAGVLRPFDKTASLSILRLANDEKLAQFAAASEGGIGLVSFSAIDPAEATPILNACGGLVRPNAISIANGTYPLTVSSYAVLENSDGVDATTILLDSLSGDAIQNLISASGFASQQITRVPSQIKGARLSKILSTEWPEGLTLAAGGMINDLFAAEQLSIRFDGTPGTDAALARARGDFVRLAEAMERGDFEDHEVIFVGFSNLDGAATALQAADRAAEQMLADFIAFSPAAARTKGTSLRAQGHGSVGVECLASEAGVAESFVEVWVRSTSVTQ
ncbi:MAG: substrate-binding domain-containing protein [Pseudomonadota bacterium]